MKLTVKKESFFNNYDLTKTSSNYEQLIEVIRVHAQTDLKRAVEDRSLYEEIFETEVNFETIYDIEKIVEVKKSYIEKLEKTGALKSLIHLKRENNNRLSKEYAYKLYLIEKILEHIEYYKEKGKENAGSFFLYYLKSNEKGDFIKQLGEVYLDPRNSIRSKIATSTMVYKRAKKIDIENISLEMRIEIKEEFKFLMNNFRGMVERYGEELDIYKNISRKQIEAIEKHSLEGLE